MDPILLISLSVCIVAIAILYSLVGHGGASGYIAVMALFNLAPVVIRPTALILNIIVSFIAALCFARAGYFTWKLFWPFAAASIPLSFVGGYLNLPPHLYKPAVGFILLAASVRLVFREKTVQHQERIPSLPVALISGGTIGLVSGLTGVGGGIFLSPLMLLMGWGKVREVSAVSALFILLNSCAGLLGHASSMQSIPYVAPVLGLAAIVGGVVGSHLGSRSLPILAVVRALSMVLVIAGIKLILI